MRLIIQGLNDSILGTKGLDVNFYKLEEFNIIYFSEIEEAFDFLKNQFPDKTFYINRDNGYIYEKSGTDNVSYLCKIRLIIEIDGIEYNSKRYKDDNKFNNSNGNLK